MFKLFRFAVAPLLFFYMAVLPSFAKHVPNLIAKDLDGNKQELSSLRGKVVVLSFWATWCGPCQEEMPRLSKLSQQYAGKGVKFIAVSIDAARDRPKIEPFLTQHEIALDVWVGPDAEALQSFGLGEIVPATIILDQQGEAIVRIMGEAREEDIEQRLDWLLDGRIGPQPEPVLKRY